MYVFILASINLVSIVGLRNATCTCVMVVRLVMMGNESSLRSIVDKIRDSIEGAFPVDVIALDMESDSEDAFHAAVHKAWTCSGYFDAFLNSYSYQGFSIHYPLMLFC